MLKAVYDRVCAAEAFVAAALLVLMVILIFLGGVMRMIGHPINWSGDAATCFFAWACFLCADIAWRKNSLMSIEVLTSKLSPPLQATLRWINYILITGFLVYLIIMGCYLSWISRIRSFQGIPEISYSWVTMSLPVGGLLLLISTVLKMRDELQGKIAVNAAADIL